jgi:GAF domain-containing protein
MRRCGPTAQKGVGGGSARFCPKGDPLSKDKQQNAVVKFAKDAVYARAIAWAGRVLDFIVIVILLLVAALVALVVSGATVPAWTLAAMVLLAVLVIYLARRGPSSKVAEMKADLATAEWGLDRHESYGEHVCQVLDHFQRALAGDIPNAPPALFIDRGILQPARDVMRTYGHADDVRLSVLLAKDDKFRMTWAAGHNLDSQQKYEVPMSDTLSRIAFEQGFTQVWDDVTDDRTFVPNRRATREFRSMVSVPILIGDRPAGVFNVITAEVGAFDPADINYITSLGSVIQVAVGMAMKEAADQKRRDRARKAIRAAPPQSRVASPRRPGRKEGPNG